VSSSIPARRARRSTTYRSRPSDAKPTRGGSVTEEPAQKSAPQKSPADDEVVRAAASNPGAPDGGTKVPLTIGGVAIGVLLVGGLIGLLLRRRATG
jgi:hypothetical protein